MAFLKQMQTALCSCDGLPYSPPPPVLFVLWAAAISSEVAWGEGLGAGLGSGCEWLVSKVIDKVNVDILTVSSLICFGWLAIVNESDLNGDRLCRILARTRRLLQRLRGASMSLRYSLVCHFAMLAGCCTERRRVNFPEGRENRSGCRRRSGREGGTVLLWVLWMRCDGVDGLEELELTK